MSRVGKNPVTLPSGVQINVDGLTVKVKGRVVTLRNDYKGDLCAVMPGLPAAASIDPVPREPVLLRTVIQQNPAQTIRVRRHPENHRRIDIIPPDPLPSARDPKIA